MNYKNFYYIDDYTRYDRTKNIWQYFEDGWVTI